uniref:Uncharacterized protein n=1 Tax=Vitis vinifera TaxID=29760 RepID=A5AQH4_VITVI|nr:hypothetical protein VITISV_005516 [Vitis vinifera]
MGVVGGYRLSDSGKSNTPKRIKEFEIRVLLVDSRWGRVKALVQMEAPGGNYRGSSEIGNGNSRRYGMQLSASNIIQAPLSALLEYSGLLRGRSSHQETESLIYGSGFRDRVEESAPVSNGGEVSIRIIGAGEQENERVGAGLASLAVGPVRDNEASVQQIAGQGSGTVTLEGHGQGQGESRAGEGISQSGNGNGDGEAADGAGANGRDSSYQRYDIQQAARWIEQAVVVNISLQRQLSWLEGSFFRAKIDENY